MTEAMRKRIAVYELERVDLLLEKASERAQNAARVLADGGPALTEDHDGARALRHTINNHRTTAQLLLHLLRPPAGKENP